MSLHSFLKDLNKRKFFKEVSVYAVVSWLIIQVAATTHSYLGVPNYAVTLIIVVLLLGLPVFMFYSWTHDIYSEITGARETEKQESMEPQMGSISKRMFYQLVGITTVLVLIFSGFIFKHNFLDIRNSQLTQEDFVAVSIFENIGINRDYDNIGKMISAHLTRGITSNHFGNVVSFATLNRQQTQLASIRDDASISILDINQLTGASKIIDGSYYVENDQLIIQANILDGQDGRVIYSFKKITCDIKVPTEGISELEQKVLGFWFSQLRNPEIQIAPKYDAYKLYVEALDVYNERDFDRSLMLLNQANAIDTNFVMPYFLKADIFYDTDDYPSLGELMNQLDKWTLNLNQRELNLIDFYKSLIKGDYSAALRSYLQEYRYHPNDLHANTSLAVIYGQLVNQPENTIATLDEYQGKEINYSDCSYCLIRLNLGARAHMKLGAYDKGIETLKQIPFSGYNNRMLLTYVQLLVRSNRLEELARFFDDPKVYYLPGIGRALLTASEECAISGLTSKQHEFAKEALRVYGDGNDDLYIQAKIYRLQGDSEKSFESINKQLSNNPEDLKSIALLAVLYGENGNREKALEQIGKLNDLTTETYKGQRNYELARIYAVLGETSTSVSYLIKSLQNGLIYYATYFDEDPIIALNLSDRELDSIINYYSDHKD